jgi:hypothetical protein
MYMHNHGHIVDMKNKAEGNERMIDKLYRKRKKDKEEIKMVWT